MTSQLRDATQQNTAFGSAKFAQQIKAMLGREVVPKPTARLKKIWEEDYS